MNDDYFMNKALEMAQKALAAGEVPVGAVVVKDGVVIGWGYNQREQKKDISSHAEIEAIKAAEQSLSSWRLSGCTLYVSLEPCLMCASAIAQAGISRLVYGIDDPQAGAITSHHLIYDDPSVASRPLVSRGVLAKECQEILFTFFKGKRKKAVL